VQFRAILARKFSKSAHIGQNKFVLRKFHMGLKKPQNSLLTTNTLKNVQKKVTPKSYRPTTFEYSNKSHQLNFSNFFPLNFYAVIFLLIQNLHRILRLLTPMLNLCNKKILKLALFKPKLQNGSKKRKTPVANVS
jgi:hypothetical protein